jgi:hypothetical protein
VNLRAGKLAQIIISMKKPICPHIKNNTSTKEAMNRASEKSGDPMMLSAP